MTSGMTILPMKRARMQVIVKRGVRAVIFPAPPSNSVLYLPLYPPSTSPTPDYSGNANNGTISGATWSMLASQLWYLTYDGTNDRVDCGKGATLSLGGALTIMAWVKLDATGSGYRAIIGDYNAAATRSQRSLDINNGRQYRFTSEAAGGAFAVASTLLVSNATWTFLGATRAAAAGTVTLYKNAVADVTTGTSEAAKIGAFADCGNTTLGRAGSYDGSYFKGDIALVALLDVALTQPQIAALFAAQRDLFGV